MREKCDRLIKTSRLFLLSGSLITSILKMISELSRKTGLSKDTIRFYEKIGLIIASDRQARTRVYKEYSTKTIERLLMINQGKGLGFTLKEIKPLLDESASGAILKSKQIVIIERKLAEIAEKMQQLSEIQTYLASKLNRLKQEVLQEP